MFLGRKKEIETLNKIYSKNKFECIIIYGRRRVGKTTIINEFIKNKKNIMFSALSSNSNDNLKALSKAIQMYFNNKSNLIYESFEDIFDTLYEISLKEQVVFVIDEFQYLAESEKKISSLLQHYIDNKFRKTKLFIILCGSSMSFMEKKVLSEKSPLFGRRTAQLLIEPLDYKNTSLFNKNLTFENNAIIYGITSGVPHYINELNVTKNLKSALLSNFLNRASYLYAEPENLLRQELREPSNYNSVIAQVANGTARLSEIADKSKIGMPQCTKYLKTLISLGIIKNVKPIIGKSKNKSIYKLKDFMFRFWYYFIQPNVTLINSEKISEVYDEVIESYLSQYMGEVFEEICKEYLLHYAKQLPINISKIGEWWGSDPVNKKEIQIDIVASSIKINNSQNTSYIVGSCKWTNEKIGISELNILKEYTEIMLGSKFQSSNIYYYLFSKNGFKNSLKNYKNKNIKLIELKTMFK